MYITYVCVYIYIYIYVMYIFLVAQMVKNPAELGTFATKGSAHETSIG